MGSSATKKKILKWRDWFYQEWQAWYLENMIETPKLTREDFIEAQKEAPKKQAEQDLADSLEEEKIKEEEDIKRSEAEGEYRNLPPEE